jgi:purine-cytosine permease-like protein
VLAITGNSWLELILIGSAVVPVSIVAVLAYFFLKRKDPDEERWRRLDEQRKEAGHDA